MDFLFLDGLYYDAFSEQNRSERYDIQIVESREPAFEYLLPLLRLNYVIMYHEGLGKGLLQTLSGSTFRDKLAYRKPSRSRTQKLRTPKAIPTIGHKTSETQISVAEVGSSAEEPVEQDEDCGESSKDDDALTRIQHYGTPEQISKYPPRLQIALKNYMTFQEFADKACQTHMAFVYGTQMCDPLSSFAGDDRRKASKTANRNARWATPAVLYGYTLQLLGTGMVDGEFSIVQTNNPQDCVHGILRLQEKPLVPPFHLNTVFIYANVWVYFRLNTSTGSERSVPAGTVLYDPNFIEKLQTPEGETFTLEQWFRSPQWKAYNEWPRSSAQKAVFELRQKGGTS